MNKFQFMGRLTKDPEIGSTTTGTQVAAFSLAVNRRFANQNGEKQTDFFNLTAFGKNFCNICLSVTKVVTVTIGDK